MGRVSATRSRTSVLRGGPHPAAWRLPVGAPNRRRRHAGLPWGESSASSLVVAALRALARKAGRIHAACVVQSSTTASPASLRAALRQRGASRSGALAGSSGGSLRSTPGTRRAAVPTEPGRQHTCCRNTPHQRRGKGRHYAGAICGPDLQPSGHAWDGMDRPNAAESDRRPAPPTASFVAPSLRRFVPSSLHHLPASLPARYHSARGMIACHLGTRSIADDRHEASRSSVLSCRNGP
jgi:hypothetical protein